MGPLAQSIRDNHVKLAVLTQEEIAENLDSVMEGQRVFFGLINNTAYVVAAVVVLIVMIMAVSERTREFGTIRAIGGSRWLVVRTVVFEATLLGFMGGVLAVPMAFALDLVIGFGLIEVVDISSLTQVALAAVILSVVAALVPAWQATRISPIEALRHE